jgi:hypothetical protein
VSAKPIHFPPMSGCIERKSYCVTISQQKRLQAQMPGIDVPRELERLSRKYQLAADNGADLPATATKYWQDIVRRITKSC